MGRGSSIKGVVDYLKQPYKIIIELYLDIDNRALQQNELRYLLLKNHELKSVERRTTTGRKLEEKKLSFRGREWQLKVIRSKLGKEGRMLANTTAPNKGGPMTANGLNRLLYTMKSGAGPRILEKVKEGYRLVGNPYLQFIRMDREKRIKECPVDLVAELRHGIIVYNIGSDDDMVKELEGEKGELYELTKALSERVVQVWSKRKIDLFVENLKRLRSVRGNGNFLGYCSEMVRWFVGSLGLEEDDFSEELKKMGNLAKDKKAREEAKMYGEKIGACKEALKKTRTDIAIPSPEAEEGRAIGSADVVEVSMLSIPIILSAEQDIAIERVIRVLVENGMIGKAEGELLLMEQEMSKLYRKRGLHEYLSSETFDEEPIVVLDARLAH
jgi:hypothetical protein